MPTGENATRANKPASRMRYREKKYISRLFRVLATPALSPWLEKFADKAQILILGVAQYRDVRELFAFAAPLGDNSGLSRGCSASFFAARPLSSYR